jgi:hypothetical protein
MENLTNSLSSKEMDLDTLLQTSEHLLSSIPTNPYEAVKQILFEPDHKFPTIEDVQVPEEVTTEGIISTIEQIETNYQKVLIDSKINPEKYNILEPDEHVTILAELSGENTYLTTQEKYKNYIEYLELVNSVDIDSVTDENCYDIIKKLGYFFVSAVNKKTVK